MKGNTTDIYFILSISSSAVLLVWSDTVHRRATLWKVPPSWGAVAACPLCSLSSIRHNEIFCSFVIQKSHEIPAKFNIRPDLRSLRPPANSILLQLPRSGKRLICVIWVSSWYTHSLFDLLLSGFWSPDAFSPAAGKFWEVGHHPKHTTYSTHQEWAPLHSPTLQAWKAIFKPWENFPSSHNQSTPWTHH